MSDPTLNHDHHTVGRPRAMPQMPAAGDRPRELITSYLRALADEPDPAERIRLIDELLKVTDPGVPKRAGLRTVAEAALLLGCNPRNVLYMLRNRQLEYLVWNTRTYAIPERALRAFLVARYTPRIGAEGCTCVCTCDAANRETAAIA